MLGLIFIILLAVGAVVGFVYRNKQRKIEGPNKDQVSLRKGLTALAWFCTGLAIIVLILSCTVQVSTKNVGIETAFGKVSGHLSNGLHVKAPWVSVTEMDAAIQTDTFASGEQSTTGINTSQDGCINVRIANQQSACVDLSIRWRINPNYADELFQNYRDFDNVRTSLVTRDLRSAINGQLADYNPLNAIVVPGASAYGNNPTLPAIGNRVTVQMTRELEGKIEVLGTIITFLHYDAGTEARIHQIQQQVALTRIAEAQQATNEAQSAANQALAASVDNSPGVLQAQCLALYKTYIDGGGKLPATGITCLQGSAPSTGVIAGG